MITRRLAKWDCDAPENRSRRCAKFSESFSLAKLRNALHLSAAVPAPPREEPESGRFRREAPAFLPVARRKQAECVPRCGGRNFGPPLLRNLQQRYNISRLRNFPSIAICNSRHGAAIWAGPNEGGIYALFRKSCPFGDGGTFDQHRAVRHRARLSQTGHQFRPCPPPYRAGPITTGVSLRGGARLRICAQRPSARAPWMSTTLGEELNSSV